PPDRPLLRYLPASKYQEVDMTAKTETDTAQRLRIAVMRLARVLRSTEAGVAADLTPTRVAVLLNVMRNSPVRLADVASQEGLNPTLLSRTVAHLEESGLVSRSADPDDRRSAWLEMTAEGKRLATKIRKQRTAAVERGLAQLSAEQREQLEGALPALERLYQELGE
ncbi:MAG: MarR family transcriptional regulator, partial [Solirubrobacterales bacterium]|nr:MarR family transcriptional regulator [Solirubrobacterales bacterium]